VDRLLGDARVDQLLQRLQRGQVGLAEVLLVGVGPRQAERLALAGDEVDREPDLLGQVVRRVLRLPAQRLLDGQQGQPVLVARRAQVLEGEPVAVELLQQLEPRRARVAVDALQQPLALEVDGRDR
jgi:hypothetical protein